MNILPEQFKAQFPSFTAALGERELYEFFESLVPLAERAGETLVDEGEQGTPLFFVVGGKVNVTMPIAGKDIDLGESTAGAVMGEVALLDGGPASAKVTALTDVQLLVLSRDRYEILRNRNPRLATQLLQSLCRTLASRTRTASDRLCELRGGGSKPQRRSMLDAMSQLLGLSRSP